MSYVDAGYAVCLSVLALYGASVVARRHRLARADARRGADLPAAGTASGRGDPAPGQTPTAAGQNPTAAGQTPTAAGQTPIAGPRLAGRGSPDAGTGPCRPANP